jgi:hypothetical protein
VAVPSHRAVAVEQVLAYTGGAVKVHIFLFQCGGAYLFVGGKYIALCIADVHCLVLYLKNLNHLV